METGGALLVLYLIYFVIAYVIARHFLFICGIIIAAIRFALLVPWVALTALAGALVWVITRTAMLTVRAAKLLWRLLKVLFSKRLVGAYKETEEPEPPLVTDGYVYALRLLGLPRRFNREEFTRAYRRAMKAAHPDAGGRTKDAQAINAARDLIRLRRDWT